MDIICIGLRPDTVGSLNFQSSFRPHSPFPAQFKKAGYDTVGIGKVFQWDGPDGSIWSKYESTDTLSSTPPSVPGSTIQPVPEKRFDTSRYPDYAATSIVIKHLRKYHDAKQGNGRGGAVAGAGAGAGETAKDGHYMISVGFGSAHPAYSVPEKYYSMHVNSTWPILSMQQSTFPQRTPIQAYRFPTESAVKIHMPGRRQTRAQLDYINKNNNNNNNNNNNGDTSKKDYRNADVKTRYNLRNNKLSVSPTAADDLHWGHAAAVSFIDAQLGRILDVVDELQLWETLTIVVTSDHGCHLGEKGIW